MTNEDTGLNTSTSKTYFNAIDKAHEILECDRDLAEKVPSCVVVGMQSVGKSAVLSRVSGISFPQDSEVCTRVAIELRLRRGQNHANKPITIKAGDAEVVQVDKTDDKAIENALKNAQMKVLKGRQFEDKSSVKVMKEDPNVPEVTLIDLPGVFFAKSDDADDLEDRVKQMIKERVENDMALILHVVPVNQDADTISTWRIVRDADKEQARTISILTKADLALKDGKDILKKRIKKIVDDSKSSECFVVHGAAKDFQSEEDQLAMVAGYIEELYLSHRIKVGVRELNEFIENRMFEHIKEKVPEMRQLLEDELQLCKVELEKVGREPITPLAIALRDSQSMTKNLIKAYADFMSDYRRLVEGMHKEIYEIEMEPLGIINANEAKNKLTQNWQTHSHPITVDCHKHHILALEIKKIGEDSRKLINLPYVGKRKELEKWLHTFVDPLKKILKKFVEDLFSAFNHSIIQPSLEKGLSESSKVLMKTLAMNIGKKVTSKARGDAMNYVEYLVDSVKMNTYTTNDHYLTDSSKAFKESITHLLGHFSRPAYRTDITPYLDTLSELLGFFKTRKKMLSDSVQLHFTKALDDLNKSTEEEIVAYMMAEKTRAMIRESPICVSKRKLYLDRENKIKAALEEISPL
eukprot:CAMPEP_0198263452 /NCGR_PEP_ID=MMETSP1447-20131203/11761_1 /TAXON_ID=420782 /ORGANISM="Chaetoceros dichaeta, Strain CCMP1751" /LENGTH=636 /DNA_ID=CAMNT_0043952021 /DNA_START=169 /DNA_END=2079 /DNA_ORIENTATION=-